MFSVRKMKNSDVGAFKSMKVEVPPVRRRNIGAVFNSTTASRTKARWMDCEALNLILHFFLNHHCSRTSDYFPHTITFPPCPPISQDAEATKR
jgi:hypothetical protein